MKEQITQKLVETGIEIGEKLLAGQKLPRP